MQALLFQQVLYHLLEFSDMHLHSSRYVYLVLHSNKARMYYLWNKMIVWLRWFWMQHGKMDICWVVLYQSGDLPYSFILSIAGLGCCSVSNYIGLKAPVNVGSECHNCLEYDNIIMCRATALQITIRECGNYPQNFVRSSRPSWLMSGHRKRVRKHQRQNKLWKKVSKICSKHCAC